MRDLVLGTTAGGPMQVDVRGLIEGRLLIQASSGGGKSYLIRKLLEVTHGQVQHLVLDVEGDFITLREKYPYVLAGTGGEAAAHPSSAGVLARKLLELRASAIIDLSDLHVSVREEFVRLFIEELMDAPRDLWAPALVVIDEAQMFAPQSQASDSLEAVRDLAFRGRKRGLAAVLATQRLSSLDKGVADVGNALIGRTGLDVDQRRAAAVLGISVGQRQELGRLHPGSFYAYGPAFATSSPVLLTVAKVETRHPQLGDRAYDPPPAPEGIREMLAALATVTVEAEEEAHTVEQLHERIRTLEAAKAPANIPEIIPCDHEPVIARLQADLEAERAESNRVHEAFLANRDRLVSQVSSLIYELSFVSPKEPSNAHPGTHGHEGAGRNQEPIRGSGAPVRTTTPRGASLADGAANEGDSPAPAGLSRLPAQPRPGVVGQSRRGNARPGSASRLPISGRDTEDMKDEEVEKLVQRYAAALGDRVEVPAAEVIRHEYQRKAVVRILEVVDALPASEREALRFMLGHDAFIAPSRLTAALGGSNVTSGAVVKALSDKSLVAGGGLAGGGRGYKPRLREWVAKELEAHNPSDTDIEDTYQAVLGRIAGAP